MAKGIVQNAKVVDGSMTEVIAPVGGGFDAGQNERLYLSFVQAQVIGSSPGFLIVSESGTGMVLFALDCSVPYNSIYRQYAAGTAQSEPDGYIMPVGSTLLAQNTSGVPCHVQVFYETR